MPAIMLKKDDKTQLKKQLKSVAGRWGVNLIGFANVDRWAEERLTAEEFYPQSIWPWARTVIVLGLQIYPPMLETTPSVVYSELYNTTNRMLDELSYKMANLLNQAGFRAFFFPRDCYGDISVLVKKPEAAFSHVIAAKYAGLGTIGANHTLLTPEYGPRVRLVSVITDADVHPNPMLRDELCIGCGRCVQACPQKAFTRKDGVLVAEMDKFKCAAYHERLKHEFRYPCGVCTAVCPVGADRKVYGMRSVSEQGITHVRSFGANSPELEKPIKTHKAY